MVWPISEKDQKTIIFLKPIGKSYLDENPIVLRRDTTILVETPSDII